MDKFKSSSSKFLVDLLKNLKCSIIFSTYEAGCVVIISAKGDKLIQLTRGLTKPMGIAVKDEKLIIASKYELTKFSNENELSRTYPPKASTYDSIYMPRATYYTGELDLHDIEFGDSDKIYAINTSFSCISLINSSYSFTPIWNPNFITELMPEDRCHLNGMAMLNNKPKYVTALSKTNTPGGWRENITSTGILIDVETDEIILENLSMPHSPRIINKKLYLLQSAKGEVIEVNTTKKSYKVVSKIPGILRGLAEYGDYIFVGVSKPRKNSKTFQKLPGNIKEQSAGIVVLYKPTWAIVGEVKYSNTINEIYDVQILPNILRPNIINPQHKATKNAITAKNLSYWRKKEKKY